MISSVREYMQAQTRDLMRSFNDAGQHPIAVAAPDQTLNSTPTAAWEWDGASGGDKAFVRHRPGSMKEYWAHVDYNGYRPAFLAFLESEFGLAASAVTSAWHVDHTLNRAFARNHGIAYVRLVLLGKDSNISYGRLLERRFSKVLAASKPLYLIDYAVMMKLLDIPVPASAQDYRARRQDIAATFVANGFAGDADLALMGLDGIFQLWQVLQ